LASRLAKREAAPDWADPLDAGERVIRAIGENQLHVITHREFRAG